MKDQQMTFGEARTKKLAQLDADFAELRQIAADPVWTNIEHPPYRKAVDCLEATCRQLAALNDVELMATGR